MTSKVFVIDDRIISRKILAKIAKSLGDDVAVTAFSGPIAALKALEDQLPDLIVTDFKMPEFDAAEFIVRLRRDPATADIPTIVVTAYEDRDIRRAALEAGATDFITSPVDPWEFRARARNLLSLRAHMKRQQQETMDESDARFEAITKAVPLPVLISTIDDGRILLANRPLADALHAPLETLHGLSTFDFYVDVRDRDAMLRLVDAEGSISGRELALRRMDGALLWMIVSTRRLTFAGRPALLSVFHDITERKRQEQELARSVERMRLITESVPALIAYIDRQDRIRFVNREYEKRFRVDRTVLEGRAFLDVIGDHAGRILQPLHRRALAGHPVNFSGEIPFDTLGVRHCQVYLTPHRDATGEITGCFVLINDVTDLKAVESELRQAWETAEQASQAKAQFFAAASHDLRQPFQAMRLFFHLLLSRLNDPGQQELAEKMQEAMGVGERLIEALLDVSTLEAGTVKPQIGWISARDFLDRIGREFEAQAGARGLAFRVRAVGGWIASDEALLHRMVSNLLANALRYTRHGKVLLGARHRGGNLRIEVWDTGVGIPQDKQQAVFEDFYQIDNPDRDRTRGLGLGLSIVARMARLLGHRVEVCSRPGKGSLFAITAPLSPIPIEPPVVPHSDTFLLGPLQGTVIVIENEPIVLFGIRALFEQWGYDVISAETTDEVIDVMDRQDVDPELIVADLRLRGNETGLEGIGRIRDRLGRFVPGLILTGDTDANIHLAAEINGTLLAHKPITPEKLRGAVVRALSMGMGK